jgi:hypothetical protein
MKSIAGFGAFCALVGFIVGTFFAAIITEGKRTPPDLSAMPADAQVLNVELISGCCYLYHVLIDNDEFVINSRGGIARK